MARYIDIISKAWDNNNILGLLLIFFITATGILADCEFPGMAFASLVNAMVIFSRLMIKYFENGRPKSWQGEL